MEKYDYFDHWLAMYHINQNDWSVESIYNHIEMYKSIEGMDEFIGLKNEITRILKNNDLYTFLPEIPKGKTIADLEFMIETILKSE